MSKYYLQNMRDAYLEAAYFTDAHDLPEHDDGVELELTSEFTNDAYEACVRFENACDALGVNIRDVYPDPTQLGHDLWFTRNRHGVGFWDRTEFYGDHSEQFTAIAHAMGDHYADFNEV